MTTHKGEPFYIFSTTAHPCLFIYYGGLKLGSRFASLWPLMGHKNQQPNKKSALSTKNSSVYCRRFQTPPLTVHDLRRTFITIAESLDISAYALKRLMNHKMNGDITASYIVTDVERLRKPMQKITDYILERKGIKPKT